MLLGIALGDACGAPFENLSFLEAQKKLALDGLSPSRYTDDTQQALAIAELMLSQRPFTPENLAESFLLAYHRDPREGYSAITRRMLASSDAQSFLGSQNEEERTSRKSDGAAMRALPIGFFSEREVMISRSVMSAAITHGHPDAIAATVVISAVAYERYHNKTPWNRIWHAIRDDISRFNPDIIPYCDACASLTKINRQVILKDHAHYGVPYTESRIFLGAVISLLSLFGDEPYRLLTEAILLGGDTDTTAAVVLGASFIQADMIPPIIILIDDLEDGPYGKKYLTDLGDMLSVRYPSTHERRIQKATRNQDS